MADVSAGLKVFSVVALTAVRLAVAKAGPLGALVEPLAAPMVVY